MRPVLALWLVFALCLLPALMSAQDSTAHSSTTPFRAGQWAAQFEAGSFFGSLGFIRFKSPTRALVLDVRLSGSHREDFVSDSGGTQTFTGLSSQVFAQLRFGWRYYHGDGKATKILSHYSVGFLAGYDHSVTVVPFLSARTNGWSAGVFGDLGGTYLVTPKLGVGALATASMSYGQEYRKPAQGQRTRDWTLGGSALSGSLVATLFF